MLRCWKVHCLKQTVQDRNGFGRMFEVPQRDFVSFSTGKTALFISYEENGAERFAIVSTTHHHCRNGSGLRFEASYRRQQRYSEFRSSIALASFSPRFWLGSFLCHSDFVIVNIRAIRGVGGRLFPLHLVFVGARKLVRTNTSRAWSRKFFRTSRRRFRRRS